MRLSNYSDYLLRVLMQAALRGPRRTTVDEVAQAYGISRNHLVKVVHVLGRNGYLKTQRGIGGGFTLAMAPRAIGLGDVVRLGERSELVIDCRDPSGCACRILPVCRLKGVLDEAAGAFFGVLDRYTLQDLVSQPDMLEKHLQLFEKRNPHDTHNETTH